MNSSPRALVLAVDDDPVNLRVLSQALSAEPFSIAVATEGEMALDQVQRKPPDLILLDALMPGMDGFEVCRRLKADLTTKEIPIIFMTALAETSDRVRGLSLGAVDYVTKPFEREELLARVRTQLALRRATKALVEKNAELEREIAERTAAQAALSRAVQDLERAQAEVVAAAEELRREREALELQATQATRIADLSTPILPITDTILVMPLVGVIDEERAERVLAAALDRTAERQVEWMILDMTGAPRTNHGCASAIIDSARALRRRGARMMVTGAPPDLLQALVAPESGPAEIVTESTLPRAIAHAMRVGSDRAPDGTC